MEIRKSLISSHHLASLTRQREASSVTAKVDAVSDRLRVGAEGAGWESASRLFDPEEIRSALQALEESNPQAGHQTQRDTPIINNRARQALNAYMAQQNLARDDARVALRQLLGVDYYA